MSTTKTRWAEKGNPLNCAVFMPGEDPKRQKSVHAWFYRNGKLHNHYILQSSYILEHYEKQQSNDA